MGAPLVRPSFALTMQARSTIVTYGEKASSMSYSGGKGGAGVYQQIINQIPPHQTYIEAFLGDGRVLRAKRPAARSIGVELDAQALAEHWRGDEVPGLSLICEDAITFLKRYRWRGGEFVYLDPPYLLTTRSSQRPIYRCEFGTIEQHRALLSLLRKLPCPVAISGYASWLYEMELPGWRMITFGTVKRSGAPATECLWMNYPEPLELHDYSYLGENFRDRERIKRKRQRWAARLRSMPVLERHALMAAIEELRAETHNDASLPGAIARNGDADEVPASIVTPDDTADNLSRIAISDDAPARSAQSPTGD